MARAFPHLTDTESVRREADAQYGGLSDAAAFLAAHKAGQDVDVAAASLRHRNGEETAKVQNDLSLAQDKVDEVHGDGTYRVIDAVVRGDALSTIVEDQSGLTRHLVVGYNDRWRSVAPRGAEAAARVQAEAEAAKTRLGAEAVAEIERRVKEATDKIMEEVAKLLGNKVDQLGQLRDDALEEATAEPDRPSRREGAEGGSPSSTEGNDTSEMSAGATAGSETDTGDGGTEPQSGSWPRTHEDLDALGAQHGVTFDSNDKIADKISKLEAAGVQPPEE